MKKLLLASLAVAAMSVSGVASAAGTISPAFTVQVALTPTCLINAGSSLTGNLIDFGTYTAFDAAPSVTAPSFTFTVKCTRDLGAAAQLQLFELNVGARGKVARHPSRLQALRR